MKKRTKKLFCPSGGKHWVPPACVVRRKQRQAQKFFGSFFQKRTASLLPTRCVVGGLTALILSAAAPLGPARSDYLQGCGGCHGVEGKSYAPRVPDLAGEAGYFLCTLQGRRYIAQLPNVAFSRLDAAQLAEVLNYVVFTLGAGSAPAGSIRFTPDEIGFLRKNPIDSPSLLQLRAEIIKGVLHACPAARGLLAYGDPINKNDGGSGGRVPLSPVLSVLHKDVSK